jgi:uracil-DNA glycosylase
MDTQKKRVALAALARKRQRSSWRGFRNLADFGVEFEFVSPYTKSASNVDSPIFVLLQDWASEEGLRGGINPETLRRGYTPSARTNTTLECRLQRHFGVSINDIYATNLFPFIKPGPMNARVPWVDLRRAAAEFALPQIEIVNPRLVIALGLLTFQAVRSVATGSAGEGRLAAAIGNPFPVYNGRVWCQAHTGWGVLKRGREQTERDWEAMATWFGK